MSRIPDQTTPPYTSPSGIRGSLRRFPWWVFLPVGLCLCGSVAAFIWMSADIQQQTQATAAARATANAMPTPFDHPPGFGVITYTPEPPYTDTLTAVLAATQTAQAAVARSIMLAATQTAIAFATASVPIATPQIINPDYTANASVSPPNPVTPNGSITITGKLSKRGQAVQGAVMSVTPGSAPQNAPFRGVSTSADGIAIQTLGIGQLAAGVKVAVDIAFYIDGQLVARTSSSFTPHK